MRTSSLFSFLMVACLSCAGQGSTAVVVQVPDLPGGPGAAPAQEPSASPTREGLRARAAAVIAAPVAFDSMTRLEINSAFPGAEKIRETLGKAGAPFANDNDWFGGTPIARWEVKIGLDVDVSVTQAVIAACVLHAEEPFLVVLMANDGGGLGHRKRVYVGALDIDISKPLSQRGQFEMLQPGVSKARLRTLAAWIEGPGDEAE